MPICHFQNPTTLACNITLPGTCTYYSGPPYSNSGIASGQNFNDVVQNLVTYIDNHFRGSTTTTTTTTGTTTSTTTSTSTSTTTTTTSSTTTTTTSHGSTTTTTTTSTTSTSTSTTTSTSTSTTTTTTTSTSTSTTTTTTTTHTTTTTTTSTTSTTTTTSSTSTTTSSTTTTTTTQHATVYWGAQVGSTPPNSTQAQAQLSSVQNTEGNVNVDFTSFNFTPQYCWALIPSAYIKSKWFDTSFNQGNIGGASDLFTIATSYNIGLTNYSVYMTQFQTQFFEATQFQP